ncbi:MAG: hypothetical protein M5U28_56290 [Sandaracinaceae bacterium]|nr:hypothetical protein [Sandaracinaceae bacterium]
MPDATATVLARLGIAPSAEMSGRVLREALRRPRTGAPLASANAPAKHEGDRARLERRLRALGYID